MSYYRNNRKPSLKHIFIVIGLIYLLGLFVVSPSGFFVLIFIIALVILIIVGIRKLFKSVRLSEYKLGTIEQKDIAKINREKHSHKCYTEGLTEGEREVARILSEGLSYKDYYIFNNVIIPSINNGSSQIDHLVISKFGIFVIESKDYKGWIFGNKDQDNWTQSLPGGDNKFQFQNPIRQNWSHIMALKDLIPFINEKSFESIIVFTNSCEIKTLPIENVVQIDSLINCIEKFTQEKLSEENIYMVIGKLSFICQTVDISPYQHIENIKLHH